MARSAKAANEEYVDVNVDLIIVMVLPDLWSFNIQINFLPGFLLILINFNQNCWC